MPAGERPQTLALDGVVTGVLMYPQLSKTVVKSRRTKQECAMSVCLSPVIFCELCIRLLSG